MATLTGNVTPAAAGLHGFDANSVLSAAMAAAFFAQGFRYAIRYIGRSVSPSGGDLSKAEAQRILDGHASFWRLRTRHYWRSGSKVPDIPQRGYQMVQRITVPPDTVNGISIDRNVTLTDGFGDTMMWLVK